MDEYDGLRPDLLYTLHVNVSPRCTPLTLDSRVVAHRNRALLFLLAAPGQHEKILASVLPLEFLFAANEREATQSGRYRLTMINRS